MARASENKLRPMWTATIDDYVIGLSWSPDGKWLAAASVSGPITIFDASNGRPIHELKGHGFGTAVVQWQPNGVILASAGQDSRVRLWDMTTAKEQIVLEGGAAWVEHLVWHSSGARLAASAGKTTRIWDTFGAVLRELPPQAGTVTDLAWRPGTHQLAVLAYGAATVYEPMTSAEPVKRFAWKGSPLKMSWSPDGNVLAHGNQDCTVHFWYFTSGIDLQMYGYASKVRELAWDFSSRYLATGGGPMVCIWDCGGKGPEGSKPQMLEGHEENLTALAYQIRGYLLASAGSDGRVILWQPANRNSPRIGQHQFTNGVAAGVAWSPDDRSLAAGSGGGTVAVFRVA